MFHLCPQVDLAGPVGGANSSASPHATKTDQGELHHTQMNG